MKLIYLIIAFFTLNTATVSAFGVLPVNPEKKELSLKKQDNKKQRKKVPKTDKPKKDNAVGALIFWWGLMPLTIAAIITLSFLIPGFGWLWFVGLAAFGLWAGISGVVFFPVQYVGLPLGMALIVYGLIVGFPLFWTMGIAVVFAAMFAFAFMVLMFTIGTRKYQPK